ncbi:MAG TPA: Crp/Fnr family transcriptional regulator [Stellaceae bacterium]|nr:Crp/Fnr family transcriptional regulator [Stellaceae bacterium]
MDLERLIAELPAASPARDLAPGQALFRQGDPVSAIFVVEHGRLRLVRHTVDDRKVVLHTARPGELLAEAALFSASYHCDAVADIASRVRVLSKPDLLAAFRTNSAVALGFMGVLAREIMTLRTRLELRSIRSARERLLQHLAIAGGRSRMARLDGSLMDLAAELGMTHETLYRTLADLEAEGILERIDGGLRLLKCV